MSDIEQFEIKELLSQLPDSGAAYHQFLEVPRLRSGIYRLRAGVTDPQQPHEEDEIYYVLEGRSRFTSDSGTTDIGPGTTLYVAAGANHRFTDITEDLTLLVFFASN
jgi:mannose-6-phosphate isomerase-like protein (cupin superfamily)